MDSTYEIIQLLIEEARDEDTDLGKALRARQLIRVLNTGDEENYLYDVSSTEIQYPEKMRQLDEKVQYLTEVVEEFIKIFNKISDAQYALDKYKTDMRRLKFNESLRHYQAEFPF